LSQTIELPPGTEPLFKPDSKAVAELETLTASAAEEYEAKSQEVDPKKVAEVEKDRAARARVDS
jgi:hypothetical protein